MDKDFLYLLFGYQGCKAVGAEQEEISRLYIAADHVDLQLLTAADNPQNKVLQGMVIDLFLTDDTEISLFLDKGMIGGELYQFGVSQTIGSAITDVADDDAVVVIDQQFGGASHPPVGRFLIDMGQDPLMGCLETFKNQFAQCFLSQPVPGSGAEKFDHGIPEEGTGQFSRGFATHSVSDQEVAIFIVDKTDVLIIRTY